MPFKNDVYVKSTILNTRSISQFILIRTFTLCIGTMALSVKIKYILEHEIKCCILKNNRQFESRY